MRYRRVVAQALGCTLLSVSYTTGCNMHNNIYSDGQSDETKGDDVDDPWRDL